MQHFLTRRWLVIHLLTLVIIAVCLALAFWQLGRLDARRADNAHLAARQAMGPVELDVLLPAAGAGEEAVENATYRSVQIRGTYDPSEQVILQSRTFRRRPGNHLLTPLVLASGEAILVNRGWVPLPTDDEVLAEARSPEGTLIVEGTLLPSEEKGFLGVSDPPPGEVTAIPRIDLDRLAGQLPYPVYPLYLRLARQEPGNPGPLPEPVPIPEPDEGPHFEYALQWFLFAGTALVIYLGLVRRDITRRRAAGSGSGQPDRVSA